MPERTPKTPHDLLRMIFRRRLLFLLSACIVTVAAMMGSHMVPLKYTGTTIFERRVDAAAEELMKGKSESFASQKLTLQNELTGHIALQRVIDELRLVRPMEAGPSPQELRMLQMERQGLEARLAENLRIDWRISSDQIDTISLSFTDADPILAEKVPNLLVQLYFDSITQQIKTRLKQSCDFLEQRVNEAKKGLQEASEQRLRFQAQHAQEFPEPGAYQARVSQLIQELQNLRPHLDLARQREAQLAEVSQIKSSSSQPSQEFFGPNPERKRLSDELIKVQEELSNAMRLKGMKDKHPYVIALRKKIDELQQAHDKAPPIGKVQEIFDVGRSSIQWALDKAALRAEVEMLTRRIAQAQEELDRLQTRSAEFSKISREYGDLVKVEGERAEDVKRWHTRLAELQMQLGAEVAQRATHQSTIQPARRQYIPSSPNLALVLAGTIIGGLAAGGGLVFLAGFFDRSLALPEDAKKHFDLPVFGTIGEIVTDRQRRAKRIKMVVLTPVLALMIVSALAFSSWSTILRLRDQEKYHRLRQQPVEMVKAALTEELFLPAGELFKASE